jgi:hypothetical protein
VLQSFLFVSVKYIHSELKQKSLFILITNFREKYFFIDDWKYTFCINLVKDGSIGSIVSNPIYLKCLETFLKLKYIILIFNRMMRMIKEASQSVLFGKIHGLINYLATKKFYNLKNQRKVYEQENKKCISATRTLRRSNPLFVSRAERTKS